MPQEISITNEDIEYAEHILLPEGETFDEERRVFIKNLETIDLQAVPGSGKTTALLAKLLILDRYLPFENGSGILVISHTNAAIEEIKNKLGRYCRNIFDYPNHIGTIQSFVDHYLAAPFYENQYKKKIFRIDDDLYNESHYMPPQSRGWLSRQFDPLVFLTQIKLYCDDVLVRGFPLRPLGIGTQTPTAQGILRLKKSLRDKGYLSFEDAFILAFEYIDKYPEVKKLLQLRFKYVFVDEVQDMDVMQYAVLEKIFFEGGSASTYQRIGDKNQAIYSRSEVDNPDWADRPQVLHLEGSYRLHKKIAQVVMPFGLAGNVIDGRYKNSDGSDIDVKPHIIVYDDSTVTQVIQCFAELIQSLIVEGKISNSAKNKYRAVGWVGKASEGGKIFLCDYHPSFARKNKQPKNEYKYLGDYIYAIEDTSEKLGPFKKRSLDALLKVLRIEGIKDEHNSFFNKITLLRFLFENYKEECDTLKLKLAEWSFRLAKGQKDEVLADVRIYIPILLALFDCEIDKSNEFINGAFVPPEEREDLPPNIYHHEGINIEVCTIHSVKGQTHTATLYLETTYHPERDGTAHESQRLSDQLRGVAFSKFDKKRCVESTKMMYVGFSRPTHFLAYAVHRERYNLHLRDIDRNLWEVVEL